VSTALGELAREGEVMRQGDGSWLLTGEPVGEPAEKNARLIPPRRRLIAALPEPAPEPAAVAARSASTPTQSRQEIMSRLRQVRQDCDRVRTELQGGFAASQELARRTSELRERRRMQTAQRARRMPAA
jgi:hypothetical protein